MMWRWIFFVFYLLMLSLILYGGFSEPDGPSQCPKTDVPWCYVTLVFLVVIHVLAGVGIWRIRSPKAMSIAFTLFLGFWFAISVTAGLHRLYTHQTYTVHPVMDLFYNIGVLLCVSSSTDSWVRTHKIHHRYSDTCDDPHYADRHTFFYSHFGWIFRKRTPREQDLIDKEDLAHLENNPVIAFQKKYYAVLVILVQCLLLFLPLLWGDFVNCFWLSMIRIVFCLNAEFSVNSLAHAFGNRPYDPSIRPAENLFVSIVTNGEGSHNYHHLYPKDFRASDSFSDWNPTTQFILLLQKCGLASNLSYFSKERQAWERV